MKVIQFLLYIFFLFLPPLALGCAHHKILHAQQQITSFEKEIKSVHLNYSYLENQKDFFLKMQNQLKQCIHENELKIKDIEQLLKNQTELNLLNEQEKIDFKAETQKLHQKNSEYWHSIVSNQALILKIDSNIDYVKKQAMYQENFKKYSLDRLFHAPELFNETIKIEPFDKLFLFNSFLKKKIYEEMIGVFFMMFFLGIATSFYLVYRMKKTLKPEIKVFLSHFVLEFPIFLPVMVCGIMVFSLTAHWLTKPPIFYLLNIIFLFIACDWSTMFYLFFLSPQMKFSYRVKINKLLSHIYIFVIIFSFAKLFILVFYGNYVTVMFLVSVILGFIFFICLTYLSLKLSLLLTEKQFYPNMNPIKLKLVRIMLCSISIFYSIMRLCLTYTGYYEFSTIQIVMPVILFIYFYKFISLQKCNQVLMPGGIKFVICYLQNAFGYKSNDRYFEAKMFMFVINIVLLYFFIKTVLEILGLPDYHITQFSEFFAKKIQIGSLAFSLINITEAFFIFSLFILLGRLLSYQISHQAQYLDSPDKMASISITIRYLSFIFGIIFVFLTLGWETKELSIIIGSIGFGISFGMQVVLKNFFAGLIIMVKKNVRVGDFIKLGKDPEIFGSVYSISSLSTQILDDNQLLVTVPNQYIIENNVYNYTASKSSMISYINLKVKKNIDVEEISKKIVSIISKFQKVHPKSLFTPDIKLLHSVLEGSEQFFILNISFGVQHLEENQALYKQIKNKLFEELDPYIIK